MLLSPFNRQGSRGSGRPVTFPMTQGERAEAEPPASPVPQTPTLHSPSCMIPNVNSTYNDSGLLESCCTLMTWISVRLGFQRNTGYNYLEFRAVCSVAMCRGVAKPPGLYQFTGLWRTLATLHFAAIQFQEIHVLITIISYVGLVIKQM